MYEQQQHILTTETASGSPAGTPNYGDFLATIPEARQPQQQEKPAHRRAWEGGIPIIPCGLNKRPLVRGFTRPDYNLTPRQVESFERDTRTTCWAFPTGKASGIAVLDFDGHTGVELGKEGGLLPNTITPSGGWHVYVAHPASGARIGCPVGILPDVDIRGRGGYVIFDGYAATEKLPGVTGGWYQKGPSDDIIGIDELPEKLRVAIESHRGCSSGDRLKELLHADRVGKVVDKFVKKAKVGTRNRTCFDMGCALRRAGLEKAEAVPFVEDYAGRVPQEPGRFFPEDDEHLKALDSAYDKQAAVPSAGSTVEVVPLTDSGNAERLAARHGKNLRYVREAKSWATWAGDKWDLDGNADANRKALETMRALALEAADIADQKLALETFTHAKRSESYKCLQNMLACARSIKDLEASKKDFDQDAFLLNCANGTVDLRTGELREHRREDMLTKTTGIEYNPDAECPQWLAFLRQIMAGDDELISYTQRAVGYSLTGDVGERCLFICHGTGANGKSTLLDAIAELAGEYGQRTQAEAITEPKRGGGINNEVAALAGVRYAYANESEEGDRLAEAKLKDLTGGDMIRARFLYQEFFQFRPQYKLWLATNHKPIARGADDGIYDRLRLIPFTVRIPEAERVPRRELAERFRAEMPGILAWAVRGCQEWVRHGLKTPAKVRQEVEDFRLEMDTLGQFLSECCHTTENNNNNDATRARTLYQAYQRFELAAGRKPCSETRFGLNLQQRGFRKVKGRNGNSWAGLVLQLHAYPGSGYSGACVEGVEG